MARTTPQISATELETLVVDVVAAEGRPVTVTEIHRAIPKALRPAAKALTNVVDALAKRQRLFRVSRRYAAQADRSLHERIVGAVRSDARTAAELAKELGAPATRVRAAIKELVTSGELHPFPKQQRVVRYAAHPPTARDLLAPELAQLLARAAKLGLDERQAKRALRELLGDAKTGDAIVDAIRKLAPDADDRALVYLPHLRTAVASSFADKASFDAAVLALLGRGTIELQSHPTPSLLGAAERDAMIEDGRGGYFSAIGLR